MRKGLETVFPGKIKILRIFILVVGFFIICAVVNNDAFAKQNAENGNLQSPRIDIPNSDIDLGVLQAKSELTGSIIVYNVGAEDLVIDKINADCNCLEILDYGKTINPGESMIVDFVYYAPETPGKVKKNIDVYSNDPEQPKWTVHLQAEIKGWFEILPYNFVYLESYEGEPAQKQRVLKSLDKEKWKILAVAKDIAFVSVDVYPPKNPGCFMMAEENMLGVEENDYIVNFRVSPNAPVGKFAGAFHLGLDREGPNQVDVYVSGKVKRKVQPSSPVISFGAIPVSSKETVTRKIDVFHVRGRPFKIISVKPEHKVFKTEVIGKNDKSRYTIKLVYNGGMKKGQKAGKLVISVDDGSQYEILIDYSIFIYKPRRKH